MWSRRPSPRATRALTTRLIGMVKFEATNDYTPVPSRSPLSSRSNSPASSANGMDTSDGDLRMRALGASTPEKFQSQIEVGSGTNEPVVYRQYRRRWLGLVIFVGHPSRTFTESVIDDSRCSVPAEWAWWHELAMVCSYCSK